MYVKNFWSVVPFHSYDFQTQFILEKMLEKMSRRSRPCFRHQFRALKAGQSMVQKANMPHKKYIKRNTLQGTNISHQWKRKQIFQLPMDGHLVGNVFFWSASQQLILQRFQLIVHESPTSYYNQHGLLYCMFPSQITRRVCVFWHLICPHLGWMLMFITRS